MLSSPLNSLVGFQRGEVGWNGIGSCIVVKNKWLDKRGHRAASGLILLYRCLGVDPDAARKNRHTAPLHDDFGIIFGGEHRRPKPPQRVLH